MPKLEVTVKATELELVIDTMEVLKDIIVDERIPLRIREEYSKRIDRVLEKHRRE